MSDLVTIYTVVRTPYTAAAKNTLGYEGAEFEVIAESENEAIRRAQQISAYVPKEFFWKVRGARIVERKEQS